MVPFIATFLPIMYELCAWFFDIQLCLIVVIMPLRWMQILITSGGYETVVRQLLCCCTLLAFLKIKHN